MEDEIFIKLKTLIEAITHSGSNVLDEDIMKQVKKICKSSQRNIQLAYDLIFDQLKKNNSQIRLVAFKICIELFKRSGIFRENVLKDLSLIYELTSEINSSKKLPPPKSSAVNLKALAVSTLKVWVKDFGETYKKLKVAYNYLKMCRKVDFETLEIGDTSEQIALNEQQRHLKIVNDEKIKKVLDEFKSNESEIELTITTLSNCLSLLLPPVDEFFISDINLDEPSTSKTFSRLEDWNNSSTDSSSKNEDKESHSTDNRINLREFGIPLNYNLTLNVGDKFNIVKTEENISIIENARDCVRLICNRYLPMIKKWINICCKCSDNSNKGFIKIIQLKEKLENILKKYNLIVIDDVCKILSDNNDSDDDFEEVKKEGYEETVDFLEVHMLDCLKEKPNFTDLNIIPHELSSQTKDAGSMSVENSNEPGSSGTSILNSNMLDRKAKLLSVAPKLPYDIDLYHWEDENLTTPTLISSKIDVDKFWGSAGSDDIHEIPNPDGVAALRTRVIEYSGKFEPVKWACRAPLSNGKLCPRKDRYKCPFHGKVVARDEMGNIQDPKEKKNSNEDSGNTVPNFQDFDYLSDLQAATGVDLKLPQQNSKRKIKEKNLTHKKMKTSAEALKIVEAKKFPGLTDVVKKQNNAYTRLSKKIFNKSSLKRVSSVLNRLDKKKFFDKFSDQFNYF